jgi:hypothetical protein
MTFAPALTWMHLFPAAAGFACNGGPEWFRSLLGNSVRAANPNVQVEFDQDLTQWTGPEACVDAVMAINCKGPSVARLAAAGFAYIRGFAAVPNLRAARWFIPIDSGIVSSSAFRLYSPTRMSARLKQSAIRALARTGMPLWYRDQVWIAQRQKPPLEQMLEKSLPGKEIRLALSAGAPEPARNRKASVAVLGLDGSMLAFAKISGSPLARRLLEHEASFLSLLAGDAAVRDAIPRPIASGDVDDRFVLIQSALTGTAAPPRLTPAHRAFLSTMESARVKPATASALVRNLGPRIAAAGDAAAGLSQALRKVVVALNGCMAPSTCMHGDFAPWNLRCGKDLLCAFDWEYGEIDGLPLVDETHHELQVGYLLKDWTIEIADQKLEDLATRETRHSPEHARAFQNIYLIDILTRLAGEGYESADPMVHWTRRLLDRRVGRAQNREIAA